MLDIFKVHTRKVPLADDVDLERLARGTVGLTGADLRNLVNEAALWATRDDKDDVDQIDFESARDKVLMGAKREEIHHRSARSDDRLSRGRPRAVGLAHAGTDPVHKVTDHPPRPRPGRHPVPARGGSDRHQRERAASLGSRSLWAAGRPSD